MLEHFFRSRATLASHRTGPLGALIDGFAGWLREQGYARGSALQHLWVFAALGRWLRRRGLGVADLSNESTRTRFLRHHGGGRGVDPHARVGLRLLLEHLRRIEALPDVAATEPTSPRHEVERSFERYLAQERGLSRSTQVNYVPLIGRLLEERFGSGPIDVRGLGVPDITAFVVRHARTLSPGRAKLMVTALRSFFRFLRLRGDLTTDLAGCVPTVPDWRLATLPKGLDRRDVRRLVSSCDRRCAGGRRDRVILLLLARLGLRAGEVVALKIEDLDWERGEMIVRGKGSRRDRLPLPSDVGAALVEYLRRDRPRCAAREVFLRGRAPIRGFASSVAICTIVRRAIKRAGVKSARKGAHLLRHALASEMLRRGASLVEIGQVLRHQLAATTEIYAKIDVAALASLARRWPGGER